MYGFCNGPAFSSGEGKFEGFSRFSMFFRSFEYQDRFPIVFSRAKCVWGPLRKCTDPYESIPSAFPCEIMRFQHFPNRFSKISVIKSVSICNVTCGRQCVIFVFGSDLIIKGSLVQILVRIPRGFLVLRQN